jgi:hypothetical protein
MADGARHRLYCCHSLVVRDAADAVRVLSVGVDLEPALEAQGIDARALIDRVWDTCRRSGGAAALPDDVGQSLRTVAQVLRIGWVADAAELPAQIICPRSATCPRGRNACAAASA